MKGFKDLSKQEIESLSTDEFVNILKASVLAGPMQIYQFPNKSTPANNDLFLLSNTSAGNITNNISLVQFLTNYINPFVQINESQVTNLIADLASKLNLSGGAMTGFLTLNADPVTALQAATKQYVDGLISPGEYLKIVNNLSDVADIFTSATNLGVGNHYVYVSSSTVLSAPLPRRIGISITASGQTLQLPDATTLNTNVIGDIFFINNFSSFDIQILDGTGSPIYLVKSGTNIFYTPDANGNVAGTWYFWPWIGSVNNSSLYNNVVDLNSVYLQTSGQNFTIGSGLNLLSGTLNINPGDLIVTNGASNIINISPASSNSFNSKVSITGTNASTTLAPTIGFFTSADQYPLLQIYPFAHGNVFLNFDCYSTSGNTYSSDPGSNFQLAKSNNQLQFNYRSGISQGSSVAFQQAAFLTSSGNFNFLLGASFGPTQSTAQRNALTLTGANNNVVNAANFYTNFDQYPLLQIEPYSHNNVNLNFDCYNNGTNFLSSNATSNFQISKINDQLQFNYNAGTAQGSNFSFQPAGYFDASGNFILNQNLIVGSASISNYAIAQFNTTVKGILPPVLTASQESTLTGLLGTPDKGLQWFNSTNNIISYWDGLDQKTALAIENIIQGSNMSITDNGDGTVTFASSGGGSTTTQIQGSFNSTNPTTSTPVTSADTPIAVSGALGTFNVVNPVGTNVSLATIGGIQTAIIQNTSVGGRWCTINYDLTLLIPTNSNQIYGFTIFTNTGAVVFFQEFTVVGTAPLFSKVTISTPVVYLNTNDYVYLTANSSLSGGPAFYAYYFNGRLLDTTVSSLPNTNALTQGTNNLYLSQNGGTTYGYLSGSATVGNLVEFNSAGGQLIDSSVPAAFVPKFVLIPGTSQQMVINTTYIITGSSTVTFTLPPTNAGIGQITVCSYGNANWIVQTNAGQTIINNGFSSSISASSTTIYDNATFIYPGNNSGIFQIVYQNGNKINLS